MPFRSKAQWRYLFAKHPKIARRWAKETRQAYSSLPKKARKRK